MIATTESEARTRGETLLIAAMGAVQKLDGRIRPLDDGTHGVNLNNHITILDRLEVPGPEEVVELTNAHRLVKIRSCDWTLLGCRAKISASSVGASRWISSVTSSRMTSSRDFRGTGRRGH